MADTKTDKEPSIEEILESIRQIISEDDPAAGGAKPAETVLAAPAEPVVAPSDLDLSVAAPAPQPAMSETILELTDRVETPMNSDLDLSVTEPVMSSEKLLSETTTEASAAAMAKLLAGNVAVQSDAPGRTGSVTLEDMISEMARPIVKTWLDQNLPRVIEKMVQKEIERISRKALDQ